MKAYNFCGSAMLTGTNEEVAILLRAQDLADLVAGGREVVTAYKDNTEHPDDLRDLAWTIIEDLESLAEAVDRLPKPVLVPKHLVKVIPEAAAVAKQLAVCLGYRPGKLT